MDGDRPLEWIGSSKEDLSAFPDDVKSVMGFALRAAQKGGRSPDAKSLTGFPGGKVLQVSEDHDGNTYRAVYTIKFPKAVYTLHAFQKKSKKGAETPKHEIVTIKLRLKRAEEHYQQNYKAENGNG